MDYCNGLPTLTKVEAPYGTDDNGSEAKKGWTKLYYSFIEIVLYLVSNKKPYILLAVHQCARFIHNNEVSNKTDVKRTCCYL